MQKLITPYEQIKNMSVDEMVLFLKKLEKEAYLAGRISAEEKPPRATPSFEPNDETMKKWLTEPCYYSYFTDSKTEMD